jgi:hypothetical protein
MAVEAEIWRVSRARNAKPRHMPIMARFDVLAGTPFDSFLLAHPELTERIWSRHPALHGEQALRDIFQKGLFGKRNQIVHHGNIDFGEAEAYECTELASTLFLIAREMERASRIAE